MLSAERLARLQDFLGTIPEPVAARLAEAVEVDRLTNSSDLPHDEILDGLAPVLRQGVLCGRLAGVSDTMLAYMERAPLEIADALPMRKMGSFGSVRVPDFSVAVAPEIVSRAGRYARFIVNFCPVQVTPAFAACQKNAYRRAGEYLTRYVEPLVNEMRSTEGPHRDVVRQRFATAVDLTTVLLGEDDADFLRRRGRAALLNAA